MSCKKCGGLKFGRPAINMYKTVFCMLLMALDVACNDIQGELKRLFGDANVGEAKVYDTYAVFSLFSGVMKITFYFMDGGNNVKYRFVVGSMSSASLVLRNCSSAIDNMCSLALSFWRVHLLYSELMKDRSIFIKVVFRVGSLVNLQIFDEKKRGCLLMDLEINFNDLTCGISFRLLASTGALLKCGALEFSETGLSEASRYELLGAVNSNISMAKLSVSTVQLISMLRGIIQRLDELESGGRSAVSRFDLLDQKLAELLNHVADPVRDSGGNPPVSE